MMKFKIGDVITCTSVALDSDQVMGLSGKIIELNNHQQQPYLVEFIIPSSHPSSYLGRMMRWWVAEAAVELTRQLSPEEIEKQRMEKIYAKIKHLYAKEKVKRTKQCQPSSTIPPARSVDLETILGFGLMGRIVSGVDTSSLSLGDYTAYIRSA